MVRSGAGFRRHCLSSPFRWYGFWPLTVAIQRLGGRKPQTLPLRGPFQRQSRVAHELVGSQLGRLAAFEDGRDDTRRQEAQPQQPGGVGWKEKGELAGRGQYRDFWDRIEAAQAKRAIEFLAAIDRSVLRPVEIRKEHVKETPAGSVREITIETRPPDIKGALWWLERRIKGFERVTELSGKVDIPGAEAAPTFQVVFTAGVEPESDEQPEAND